MKIQKRSDRLHMGGVYYCSRTTLTIFQKPPTNSHMFINNMFKLALKTYLSYRPNASIHSINCHIPIIYNPIFQNQLKKAFDNPTGGISVIAAPPGSGKSKYLEIELKKWISNKQNTLGYHFNDINNTTEFLSKFGITTNEQNIFFQCVPKHYLIVLNIHTFNNDIANLLQYCLTESSKREYVNIIVEVSDYTIAQKILNLNGKVKVRLAADPQYLKLSNDQIHSYKSFETKWKDFENLTKNYIVL